VIRRIQWLLIPYNIHCWPDVGSALLREVMEKRYQVPLEEAEASFFGVGDGFVDFFGCGSSHDGRASDGLVAGSVLGHNVDGGVGRYVVGEEVDDGGGL